MAYARAAISVPYSVIVHGRYGAQWHILVLSPKLVGLSVKTDQPAIERGLCCGMQFYVEMTTRKLQDRAREHVLSASERNNNTVLGDHYWERHTEKEKPTKKSSKSFFLNFFTSPVLLHYLDIQLHVLHFPSLHLYVFIILTFTRSLHTSPNLTPVPPPHTAQHNSSFPFFFSTNPIHALPINLEPRPLSVQTYSSVHGYWSWHDWRWCWTSKRLKVQPLPCHRICHTINKLVYYQHLRLSFEESLSLRLSDPFASVVGWISINWLNV